MHSTLLRRSAWKSVFLEFSQLPSSGYLWAFDSDDDRESLTKLGFWFSHDAAYGTRKFWCVCRTIRYRFWELILNKLIAFYTLVNKWQWTSLAECGKRRELCKVRGWKAIKLKGKVYHYTVRDSVTSFVVYSYVDLKTPSRILYEQGVWDFGNK